MGKTFETSFELGARLDRKFGRTMSRAERALDKLGQSAKKLAKVGVATKKFERLQAEIAESKTAFAAARVEVDRLSAEMAATNKPSADLRERFREAKRESKRLEQQIARKKRALGKLGDGLREAGVDTSRLAAEQQRLHRKLEASRRKMAGLALVAESRLGRSLRGVGRELKGLGVAAGAAAVGGLYKVGRVTQEVDEALSDLATLESLKPEQIEAIHKAAIKWSEKHGTKVPAYLVTAYNTVSAGITDTNAAIAATEQAIKLGRATKADEAKAMKQLAALYNNVRDKAKPAGQELERLSDILAKTQQTFSISDLSQLGEGLKYGLAEGLSFGVRAEQVAAAVGQLNTRSLEGSQAGTAFAAALRKMGDASKVLKKYDKGFKLAESDGGIDFVETLARIDAALAKAESSGKRAGDVLQKAFGAEGSRAISLLRGDVALLRDYQKQLQTMRGATERAFQKKDATTRTKLLAVQQRLNNKLYEVGTKIVPKIEASLPTLERFIDKLPGAYDVVSSLAGKLWDIVESVGGIETILYGLAGLKLAKLAVELGGVAKSMWTLGKGVWKLAAPDGALSKLSGNLGKLGGKGGLVSKLAGAAGKLGAVGGPVAVGTAAIAAWGTAIYNAIRAYEEWKELKAAEERNKRIDSATNTLAQRLAEKRGVAAGDDVPAVWRGVASAWAGRMEAVRAYHRRQGNHIEYRPQITVQAGAHAGADVDRALKAGASDLSAKMDERRRSFE